MATDGGERDVVRSAASGCLASPVGFGLSALMLIPLWWMYPFSTGDSSSFISTVVSFLAGVLYAVLTGAIAGFGIPRRWWSAAALVVAGVGCGVLMGLYMRDAMVAGCLQGTGPQPEYCHEEDPSELRPVVPAYAGAGALLGLGLWVAGALNLGRRVGEEDDRATGRTN